MQIRKVGNRLRLIRNVYDPAAKRGKQVQLGSIPDEPVMPTEGLENLTEVELAELKAHIRQMQANAMARAKIEAQRDFAARLKGLADVMEDQFFSPEKKDCIEAYEALDRIAKAMRDRGFTRKSLKASEAE